MATLNIPLPLDGVEDKSVQFEAPLDGTLYRFLLRYNARDGDWHLTVKDTDDAVLLGSKRLTNLSPLLFKFRWNPLVPQGELIVVDQGGDVEPDFASMGTDHLLVYFEESEFA